MKSLMIVALTLTVLLSCSASRVFALEAAPKITVDMAGEPIGRWKPAIKLVIAEKGWASSFGGFFSATLPLLEQVPSFVFPIFQGIFEKRFPVQYLEFTGILDEFHDQGYLAEYNMTRFSALAFVYELSHINTSASTAAFGSKDAAEAFSREVANHRTWETALKEMVRSQSTKSTPVFQKACTGIISLPLDPTQEIIHARNLDESPRECRNFTLDITVVHNGTYMYSIFDYTWLSTGMFTSNRVAGPTNGQQGLTLEENWRNDDNPSFEDLLLRLLDPKTVPIAFLFRQIQERGLNFTEASHYLLTASVASPGYFILTGTGRLGAVITLSFEQANNRAQFINDTTATATATTGGGYGANWLIQTNSDFWMPNPVGSRRWVAMQTMDMIGNYRAGTELGVWMTISTWPVHNPDTLFTALMGPGKETEGYIRMALEPGHGYYP